MHSDLREYPIANKKRFDVPDAPGCTMHYTMCFPLIYLGQTSPGLANLIKDRLVEEL
jgi:hypothetical protein